jgi:putative ABC transport system ATP-binding protein
LPLLYQKFSKPERKKMVKDVMEKLNILPRRGHFPQQLSGGQQQRVAVARAIVAKPKMILADEPTGNLDSENGEEVMNLLTQLHEEGATIIMVTHSPTDAECSQRIINLFDGHIITEKKKKEFHL